MENKEIEYGIIIEAVSHIKSITEECIELALNEGSKDAEKAKIA